ncbi:hypothetical protein WG906_06655 [Pedobacter sp. P351]|uniref:hypothetical protein n=1 Tax=Pedobacter superstes TaxID=3133441 RepID=UPI0030A14EB5
MYKKYGIVLISLLLMLDCYSQSADYQVGQRVEAYNVGWYKATIIEIGTGTYAGYFKVDYDDYASHQYLSASNIRVIKAAKELNYTAGPRNGRYTILSYGIVKNAPLILGYFDLNNRKYTSFNAGKTSIGKGTYRYDEKSKNVIWESGPLTQYGRNAAFQITREGKTHILRIRSNNTIGTNSTD